MTTLLTGAHGTVGTAVTTHSDESYVLLDLEPAPAELGDGSPHPHRDRETVILDVGDADAVTDLAAVMTEHAVDAVVHLAGASGVNGSYDAVERNNVRGTRHVVTAAADADVDTVVFASSNHVVGMYEVEHAPELYDPDFELTVDHESPIRPDSEYGASKAAGEAWCRLAAERDGVDCYALRIGSVRDPTYDHPYGDAERAVARGDCERGDETYAEAVARMRCTWLSRRDCAQLVGACLADGRDAGRRSSPDTLAGGVFEVFYGISESPAAWLDIDDARERVGYEPQDSAVEMTAPPVED